MREILKVKNTDSEESVFWGLVIILVLLVFRQLVE